MARVETTPAPGHGGQDSTDTSNQSAQPTAEGVAAEARETALAPEMSTSLIGSTSDGSGDAASLLDIDDFAPADAPAPTPGAQGEPVIVAAFDARSGDDIAINDLTFMYDASFERQGSDLLLIKPDGTAILIENYFSVEMQPDLTGEMGRRLTPELIDSFLMPSAPGQTAALDDDQLAQVQGESIGSIDTLTGEVYAVRPDGTRVLLEAGDPVFQGDQVETGDGSSIKITFADGTIFTLGADAKLALDEMVYDPATQSGSSAFSILKGGFLFVSGQIAQSNPNDMQVTTPVATIGIRGTIVTGEVSGLTTPDGETFRFTVVDGEIAVAAGSQTIVLSDNFSSVSGRPDESGGVRVFEFQDTAQNVIARNSRQFKALSQEDIQKIQTAVETSIREQTGESVTIDLKQIVEDAPEEPVRDEENNQNDETESDGETDDENQQFNPDDIQDEGGDTEGNAGEEGAGEEEVVDEEGLEEDLAEEDLSEEELQVEGEGEGDGEPGDEEFAADVEGGPGNGSGDGDGDINDTDLAALGGDTGEDGDTGDEGDPDDPQPGEDQGPGQGQGPVEKNPLDNVIVNKPVTTPSTDTGQTNNSSNNAIDEIVKGASGGQQGNQNNNDSGSSQQDDDETDIPVDDGDDDLVEDLNAPVEVALSDFTSGGGNDLSFDGSTSTQNLSISLPSSTANITASTGDGDDDVETGSGNDNVDTGDGDDTIKTGDGNDVVNAGAGDDTIVGGTGNGDDIYRGDAGDDIVTYDSVTGTLTTSLSATLNALDANSFVSDNGTLSVIGNDTLTNIENIRLGDGDDTITVNTLEINVDGDVGTDTLRLDSLSDDIDFDFASGLASTETSSALLTNMEVFVGGAGDDTVSLSNIEQSASAGSGSDTLDLSQLLETGNFSVSMDGNTVDIFDLDDERSSGAYVGFENLVLSDLDDDLTVELGSISSVDGGAGDDLLTVAPTGSLVTATLGGNITGFETLDLSSFDAAAASVFTMSFTDTEVLNNTENGTLTIIGADESQFNALQSTSGWNAVGTDNEGFAVFESTGNDAVLRLSSTALAGASGALTYTSAVDNQWFTGGNWLDAFTGGSGSPTNGDIAVLDASGETVTFSTQGSLELLSLTGAGDLDIQSGFLRVNDPVSLSGTLTIGEFESIRLDQGGSIDSVSLNNLTDLTITTGVLTVDSLAIGDPQDTLSVADIRGSGTLSLTGTSEIDGGIGVQNKLIIGSTATINTTERTFFESAGGSVGQVLNLGEINAESLNFNTLTNQGTINVDNGGSTSGSGRITLESGALNIIGSDLEFGGFGETMTLNGGVISTSDGGRLIIANGAKFEVGTGQTFTNTATTSSIAFDNGTLLGAGTFINEGTMAMDGEAVDGVTFVNNGVIEIASTQTMVLSDMVLDTRDGEFDITTAGSMRVTSSRIIVGDDTLFAGAGSSNFNIRLQQGSTVEVASGESITIDGQGAQFLFEGLNSALELNGNMINTTNLASFDLSGSTAISGDGTLVNSGTVTFNSDIVGARVENTGTVAILGTTSINDVLVQSGHLDLGEDAQITGTGTIINTGTIDFSTSGQVISTLTLDITDGTLEADDVSDVLTLDGVNLLVGADTEVGSFGTLNITGSAISVAAGETVTIDQEPVLSESDSELTDGSTASRTQPDIVQFANGKYIVSWHDDFDMQVAILDTDGTTVLSNASPFSAAHGDLPVQIVHSDLGGTVDDAVVVTANNSFLAFATFDSTGASQSTPGGGYSADFVSYDVTELGTPGNGTGVAVGRITSSGTVFLDITELNGGNYSAADAFSNPTSIQIDTLPGTTVIGDIQMDTLNDGRIATIYSSQNGANVEVQIRITDVSDPQAPVTLTGNAFGSADITGSVDLVATTDGNFVAVFQQGSSLSLHKIDASDNTLITSTFANVDAANPSNPQLIALANGNFRILYEGDGTASGTGIDLFSRDFSGNDLLPITPEVVVANDVGNQTDAAIAIGANTSDSVVIYTGPGSSGEDLFIANSSGGVLSPGLAVNLSQTTIDGPGVFENNGLITVDDVTVGTASVFDNNGSLAINAGGVTIDGVFSNDGSLTNNGAITVNGTFTNSTSLDLGDAAISAGGTLNNIGTIVSLGSSGETITIDGIVNQSGILELAAGGSISGSGTINNTGTIDFSATGAEITGVTMDLREGFLVADEATDTLTLTDAEVLIGDTTDLGTIGVLEIGGSSTLRLSSGETVTLEAATGTPDVTLNENDNDARGAPTVTQLSNDRFAVAWNENGVTKGVILDTDGRTAVDSFTYDAAILPVSIVPDQTGGGFFVVAAKNGNFDFEHFQSDGVSTEDGAGLGLASIDGIDATPYFDGATQTGFAIGISTSAGNEVSLKVVQGTTSFSIQSIVLDNTVAGDLAGGLHIDTLSNGNIVATFMKDNDGTKVQKTVMVSFANPASPASTSTVTAVNTTANNNLVGAVDVVALIGGGFATVSATSSALSAEIFDATGSSVTSLTLDTDASSPANPTLVALPSGGFRVVYEGDSAEPGNGTDLYFRDYSATDGSPIGTETLLAGSVGNQTEAAAVLGNGDSDLVAVFSSPDDDILVAGDGGSTTTASLSLTNGATIDGDGVLQIDSELSVDGVTIAADAVVDNNGTLSIGSNGLVINGLLTNDGSTTNGGTITVNGSFTNTSVFDTGGLTVSDTGVMTNTGTLTNVGAPGDEVVIDGVLNQSGVLVLASDAAVSGTGSIINAGTIDFSAGVSTLTGLTIDLTNGALTADEATDELTLTDVDMTVSDNTEIGDFGTITMDGNSTFRIADGETVRIDTGEATNAAISTELSDGGAVTRSAADIEKLVGGKYAVVWTEDGTTQGVILAADGNTVESTFTDVASSQPPKVVFQSTTDEFAVVHGSGSSINIILHQAGGLPPVGSVYLPTNYSSFDVTELGASGSTVGMVVGRLEAGAARLDLLQGTDTGAIETVTIDTFTGTATSPIQLTTLTDNKIMAVFAISDAGTTVIRAGVVDPGVLGTTGDNTITHDFQVVSGADADLSGDISVTALTNGNAVVVYRNGSTLEARTVIGSGGGTNAVTLATNVTNPANPKVVALDNGGFRVIFEGDGTGTDIYQHDYNSNSTSASDDILLVSGAGNQTEVAAETAATDGDTVVVFSGAGTSGDDILLANTTASGSDAVLKLNNGTTIEGPGTLVVQTSLDVDGVTIGTTGIVTNDGTLSVGTNGLVIDGTMTNDGVFASSGSLTVGQSGTLTNTSTLDLGNATINGELNNSGVLANVGESGETVTINSQFDQTGVLQLGSGGLLTGSGTIVNTGTIDFSSGNASISNLNLDLQDGVLSANDANDTLTLTDVTVDIGASTDFGSLGVINIGGSTVDLAAGETITIEGATAGVTNPELSDGTSVSRTAPDVAELAGGRYVTVWGEGSSPTGVVLDTDGTTVLGTISAGSGSLPPQVVARSGSNDFAVVTGDSSNITLKSFSDVGAVATSGYSTNGYLSFDATELGTVGSTVGLVIGRMDLSRQVEIDIIPGNSTASRETVAIGSFSGSVQSDIQLATLANDDVVAVFSSTSGGVTTINMITTDLGDLSTTGDNSQVNSFQVASGGSELNGNVSVAALAGGGAVVVYRNGTTLEARITNAAGGGTNAITLATDATNPSNPQVIGLSNGNFRVVFEGDGNGTDIFQHDYTGAGASASAEVTLITDAGNQADIAVESGLSDSSSFIAYAGPGTGGDDIFLLASTQGSTAAAVNLTNGTTIDGTGVLKNDGSLSVDGVTIAADATVDNNGTLTVGSNGLEIDGLLINDGTLVNSGTVTVNVDGTLVNNSTLDLSGGGFVIDGVLDNANGVLSLNDTALTLSSGATTLDGTLALTGSSDVATNGGTGTVTLDGVLTSNNDADADTIAANLIIGAGGQVIIGGANGADGTLNITGEFTNNGVVHVDPEGNSNVNGVLNITQDFENTGTIIVDNAATLNVGNGSGSGTITNTGLITGQTSGIFEPGVVTAVRIFNIGEIRAPGATEVGATLALTDMLIESQTGTLTIESGGRLLFDQSALSIGTATTLNSTGGVMEFSGLGAELDLGTDFALSNDGGTNIVLSSGAVLTGQGTLVNHRDMVLDGVTIDTEATFINSDTATSGTVSVSSGETLTINGSLESGSNGTILVAANGVLAGTGSVIDQSTLQASGITIDTGLSYSGNIELSGSTALTLNGTFTGEMADFSAGGAAVSGTGLMDLSSLSVSGPGLQFSAAVDTILDGDVNFSNAAGRLQVVGSDLTLTGNTTFSGGGNGTIVVNGGSNLKVADGVSFDYDSQNMAKITLSAGNGSDLIGDATFNNIANSTLVVAGDTDFLISTLNNAGLITMSNSDINIGDIAFNNTGFVNLIAATDDAALKFAVSDTLTGTVLLDTATGAESNQVNAFIEVNAGQILTLDGVLLSTNSEGASAGPNQLFGTFVNTGSIEVQHDLSIDSTSVLDTSNGGILIGSGQGLSIEGELILGTDTNFNGTGGNVNMAVGSTLTVDAGESFDTDGDAFFIRGATIDGGGTITNSGDSMVFRGGRIAGLTFNNQSQMLIESGTLQITTGGFTNVRESGVSVGTIHLEHFGTGTAALDVLADFANDGHILLAGDEFGKGAKLTTTGTTTLTNDGSGVITSSSEGDAGLREIDIDINNFGTIGIEVDTVLTAGHSLDMRSGTLSVLGGATFDVLGTLIVDDSIDLQSTGAIQIFDALRVENFGTFTFQDASGGPSIGFESGSSMIGTGTFINETVLTLGGVSILSTEFINTGTVEVTTGGVTLGPTGLFDNDLGRIEVNVNSGNGVALNVSQPVDMGGTLVLDTVSGGANDATLDIQSSMTLTGTMISRDSVSSGARHVISGDLINEGTINMLTDLQIDDTLDTRDGDINLLETSAVLDLKDTMIVGDQTRLRGDGTVHLGTAAVIDVVESETFTIESSTLTTSFFYDNGAQISGLGTLQVDGTMAVSGATVNVANVVNNGVMEMSDLTTHFNTSALEGNGTLLLSNNEIGGATLNLLGDLVNSADHTINITSAGTFSNASVFRSSAGATLTNAGQLTGTVALDEHTFDLDIINTGNISMENNILLTANHVLDTSGGELTVDSAHSALISGTLLLGSASVVSGTFNIQGGGHLAVGTGETFITDGTTSVFDFTGGGGVISGPGTLRNTGTIGMDIGGAEIAASTHIDNDGVMLLSSDTDATILTSNFDNSAGTVTIFAQANTANTLTIDAALTNAGSISIGAEGGNGTGTAVVKTTTSGSIVNTGSMITKGSLFGGGGNISVLLSVINTGTFAALATTSFASGAVLDTKDGTLGVANFDPFQNGISTTLSFADGATLIVGEDTTLLGDDAPNTLTAGTIDILNGGVLDLTAGEIFTISTTSPRIDLQDGSSLTGTGSVLNNGVLGMTDVDIAAGVTIDNDAEIAISDGTLTLNSNVIDNDGGTINIVGVNTQSLLQLNTDFTNNGVINVAASGEKAGIVDVSIPGVTLFNTGSINFTGGNFSTGVLGKIGVDVINTGAINVNGLVRVLDGANLDTTDGVLNVINPSENADFRLTIKDGAILTLGSNTDLTGNGQIRFGNGAEMKINAGQNFVYQAADPQLSFDDDGTPFTDVTIAGGGTFTNQGTLVLSSEVSLSVSSLINTGTIDSADGILNFTGTTLEIGTGGQIFASALSGTGSIINNSANLVFADNMVLTGAISYTNNGSLDLFNGFTVGAGTSFVNSAGADAFYDSGVLTIDGSFVNDGSLSVSGGTSAGSGALTNNGVISLDGDAGPITADFSNFSLENDGTLDISGGGNGPVTLSVNEMQNNGIIAIEALGDGASAKLKVFNDGTGTLTNSGLIHSTAAGTVTNGLNTIDGSIQSGATGGTIQVDAHTTLTVDHVLLNEQSRVIVETGSGASDGATLNVVDSITYGGSFEVRIDDSFASGYNLVSASSSVGSFHRVLLKNGDGTEDFSGLTSGNLVIPSLNGSSFSLAPATSEGGLLGNIVGEINELLTGHSGANSFLSGDSGSSTWFGLGGNDSFTLEVGGSINFLDGGSGGGDILFVDQSNFGQADAWRFNNLEALDISGAGAGTIAIDSDFVFGASEDLNAFIAGLGVDSTLKDDALIIAGESGQTLDLSSDGSWSDTGLSANFDIGNGAGIQSYAIYSASNGADVYVDTDVNVQLDPGELA